MADDQSRPSENEHQDAESEETEPRRGSVSSESDGEAEPEADSGNEARRASEDAGSDAPEDGEAEPSEEDDAAASEVDDTLDASEGPDSEGTIDAERTVEADAADAEDSAADEAGASGESGNDSDAAASESAQTASDDGAESDDSPAEQTVPEDVQKYARFKKMDGAQYDRVNEFLRERTYITAREWAIARLCADFRTETGVEMTKIGENLPELVPFMTDTYTPQAVNQARSSFENKVRQSGATFLYGAMSGFFTAEELDDMMYEVTEVAKFLLEVEGVDLSVDEELEAEDRISGVMREVQSASEQLRHDEMECPNCGHEMEEADAGSDD